MKIVISQHTKEESRILQECKVYGIAIIGRKIRMAEEMAKAYIPDGGYTQVCLYTASGLVAQWTSEYGWSIGKELAFALMYRQGGVMAA